MQQVFLQPSTEIRGQNVQNQSRFRVIVNIISLFQPITVFRAMAMGLQKVLSVTLLGLFQWRQ